MDQELNRGYTFLNEQYWYASTFLKTYLPYDDYENIRFLDIGSGEGGCLKFFNEKGAVCYGIEISKEGIQFAIANNRKEIHFILGDICDCVLIHQLPRMHIIIVRDVIEHIHQKKLALQNIKKLLKKEGVCFIAYPPKYSPYGGHQQNIKNSFTRLPYIHLFPEFIYSKILKWTGVEPFQINSLLETHKNMISLKKIERMFSQIGFEILKKDMYFIRPSFEKRYGIKPRKTIFNRIPVIKEFCTLGALYLLKKNG
ncbi:class I SAM-dependent methyltransferase [bacterium]|nr:class I SAM-dependent methyltransferase [bacterium]RQV93749.1 MAG: class I SAM-dependent methyltransferase [bacterium]